MAKRRSKGRRFKRFARVRSGSRFKRRSRSRKGNSTGSLTGTLIGAAVYGAGREWMSNKLSPLTSKVPAGDLADEVTLGAISYFMAKGSIPLLNKVPYSREIGRAGLTIEAARAGAYLGGRMIPSASPSNGGVVYL